MSDGNDQKKEHPRISIRIGDAQVELEGTFDDIKKLMSKELVDFTKGLEETTKRLPPSTEMAPKITPKTPEVTPREKPVPPPSKPPTPSETLVKTPVSAVGKATGKVGKRKLVSRNAAIALVLVLVLLASLVSVIAIYVPMVSNLDAQIAEKDDTIASLNSQLLAFQSVLNQLANNITAKDEQISALTSQLNSIATEYNAVLADYNAIINLGKSGYLLNNFAVTAQVANSSTVIWNDVIKYAGYITVELQSTSNTTYARLVYASYGVNFDQVITLGESGTAAFPVLPGEIVVSVGNAEPVNSVNATVTARYVY